MSSVPLRIQLQFLSLCSYLDFLPWLPSGDRLSSGCVWWNRPSPFHVASGDGVFNSNSKNQAGCAWTEADMSAKLCGAPLGWLESLCPSLLHYKCTEWVNWARPPLVISETFEHSCATIMPSFTDRPVSDIHWACLCLPFVSWHHQRLSSDMRFH